MIISLSDIRRTQEVCSGLDGYYAMKIRSHLNAYGTDYDFCRFFAVCGGSGQPVGCISLYNSAMTIAFSEKCDLTGISDELCSFASMTLPQNIECPLGTFCGVIDGFSSQERLCFSLGSLLPEGDETALECSPALDRVYGIISRSFPETDYGLWYTDASHRIRHGISKAYLYRDSCTAFVELAEHNTAYISCVSTLPDMRGRGFASQLLGLISRKYSARGIECRLWALEPAWRFYRHIRLSEINKDCFFTAACGDIKK